jgi:hypothetical protein
VYQVTDLTGDKSGVQQDGGKRGMRIEFWLESQKERDHKEDQDVGGWIILKCILER